MKQWFYMVLCVPMLFILNESSVAQSPVKVVKSTETVQQNQSANEISETDNNALKTTENSLAKSGKSAYILTNQIPNRSTSSVASWDFTTSADKYYGGATGAKELETDVWGMIAGDTNGDGTVGASDRNETWNDTNNAGYLDTDCDLNSSVGASDRNITWNNRTLFTTVP
jgi:hypothetical protein